MTSNQLLAKLETAFQAHNALVLNVGDFVFAPIGGGEFVNAYVHSFDAEFVTFQTIGGFQWLMTVEEASAETFLIERFEETGRAKLIAEIKKLWKAA